MDRPDYVGVALYHPDASLARASIGGRAPEDQTVAPPRLYSRQGRRETRTHSVILRMVQGLGIMVIGVFPLLSFLDAAARGSNADVINGLWVGSGVLTVMVLLLLFWAARGRPPRQVLDLREATLRQRLKTLGFDEAPLLAPEQLRALCDGGPPPQRVRLRGRVARCRGAGAGAGALLRDAWLQGEQLIGRLVVGQTFAVLADDQPPVVVELKGGPWIAGTYHDLRPRIELDTEASAWIRAYLEEATGGELHLDRLLGGLGCALEPGDEVELVAGVCKVVHNIDDLAVGGQRVQLPEDPRRHVGSPYRGDHTRPGLLVTSTADAPAMIRLL